MTFFSCDRVFAIIAIFIYEITRIFGSNSNQTDDFLLSTANRLQHRRRDNECTEPRVRLGVVVTPSLNPLPRPVVYLGNVVGRRQRLGLDTQTSANSFWIQRQIHEIHRQIILYTIAVSHVGVTAHSTRNHEIAKTNVSHVTMAKTVPMYGPGSWICMCTRTKCVNWYNRMPKLVRASRALQTARSISVIKLELA